MTKITAIKLCDIYVQNILKSLINFIPYLQQYMSSVTKLIPSQSSYLTELVNKYPTNFQVLSQCLSKMNDDMQRKIQDGEQRILKKSTTMSQLKSSSNHDVRNFLEQRKSLQEKLKSMGKSWEKESKTQMVLSDQERLQFLKKMKQKQQQVQRMREEQAQIRLFKERQLQQEQKFQKERKLKEEQKKKRKQIEKKLEEIEEERERREEEIRQRNREYQQIMHEKTLFHKIEQNYNKLQNLNLEEKKKKLAEIRQIHKPLSKTDFREHLKHIDECKQLTFHRKSAEKDDQNQNPTTNMFYKSHWYRELASEEKIKEEQLSEEKKQAIKELKDRQKKYSQYIRHNCMPDTDEKLIEEMEKRFPSPIKRKKAKQIRQMGIYNLKASKEQILPREEYELKKQQQKEKAAQATIQKPKNYLEQLKQKRRSHSLSENFLTKINKQDKPEKVKMQTVKTFAEKLERKAEMREQLHRVKKNVVDAELDQMYIGALNAKLKLLPEK